MIGVYTAPVYGPAPPGRAHVPPAQKSYDLYRSCLRREFFFRCVYCLSTEMEVAPTDNYGGFEIEHFKPKGNRRFRGLVNHYPNLLWACHACNRAKGDEWPSGEELARGMRFVNPSTEALSDHLQLAGDLAAAMPGSVAGEYMIDVINLNAGLHTARRRRRTALVKKFVLLESICGALRIQAGQDPRVQSLLDSAESELSSLRELVLGSPDPWDVPLSCACDLVRPLRRLTKRERKAQRLKARSGSS